uniref:Uncharacterized protein n=1 Tax=Rousettus aegyptiacus TaxID=9407 RepID=A0A7J8H1C1_ROUAE|nr:hypothetical protein HJG63_011305 [Rousettus aegyptiacus]
MKRCMGLDFPIINLFNLIVSLVENSQNTSHSIIFPHLKNERILNTPFDPAIALLGIYPKKIEIIIHKGLCTPIFMTAQFIITKIWKQPKCPSSDNWKKKLWFVYTIEYYSAIKKKMKSYHLQQHGWTKRLLC